MDVCNGSINAVEIKNLEFKYQNNNEVDLSIPDLEIKKGECVLVLGKSGSSKTTFFRLLNGLIPEYYQGKLDGLCKVLDYVVGKNSLEEFSNKIGSIFQFLESQFFYPKIIDELVFPCENQGISDEEIKIRLNELLTVFDIKDLLHKNIHEISGGQAQILAMMVILMQNPELILLDEPTSNLDNFYINKIKEVLLKLKQMQKTIIIIEHRIHHLIDVVDRVLIFENGKIIKDLTIKEFLNISNKTLNEMGLRSYDISNSISIIQTKKNISTISENLKLKKVKLGYHNNYFKTIDNISFGNNQIIGISGKNGSGKTTLAYNIAGIYDSKENLIYYNDKLFNKNLRIKNTSLLMQDVRYQLFCDSVKKELCLGNENLILYDEVVEKLALKPYENKHPAYLSGGWQQRLLIGSTLLMQKKIIILDEATSGLDYEAMDRIFKLLKSIKNQDNMIIVISHDEEFLANICDIIIEI